ncbi:MAG: HEAT repeat domain-containing protein [Polyangiaceae bacterium]
MNTKKLQACNLSRGPSRALRGLAVGAVVAAAAFAVGPDAKSDPALPGGMAAVYGAGQGPIMANSTEFLSTEASIISMASSGAPSALWQTLEHGEQVQCLNCIGAVAPLLYDSNAKNREISAWWLRRRMLGVFGPGQVYEQTLTTLASDPSPTRRGYAASAIGEFLIGSGIPALITSVTTDSDPGVRAAAASALGRLNDDGSNFGTVFPAALTVALGDSDSGVRVAALEAAGRVNVLSDPTFPTVLSGLVGSSDPLTREHAVQLMDEMHLSSAVAAITALAKGDPVDTVRLASCHALGTIGNATPGEIATLQSIAASDSSGLVQDMANIALLMVQ